MWHVQGFALNWTRNKIVYADGDWGKYYIHFYLVKMKGL